jgi:hypothetical protein
LTTTAAGTNAISIKGRRLNIQLHGSPPSSVSQTVASSIWTEVGNSYLQAELDSIDGIRLVSCHAGEAGGVAAHLAKISGRPVKSYLGDVSSFNRRFMSRMLNPRYVDRNFVAKPYRAFKSNATYNRNYQVSMFNAKGLQTVRYEYDTNGARVLSFLKP